MDTRVSHVVHLNLGEGTANAKVGVRMSVNQSSIDQSSVDHSVSPVEREKVRFVSGDADCVAWHYPGTNGACVIMTGGFAVTKEPGTDRFARRFHEAGFSVLALITGASAKAAVNLAKSSGSRSAGRLAGRDLVRRSPTHRRSEPDRDLELLPVGRAHLPRGGPQSPARGRDRANAHGRWSGRDA